MPVHENLFVTFKATLQCNLACLYCYGRNNHSIGKSMSDEEIKQGLVFVCEYAKIVQAKRVSVCWHGGEPLLLSPNRMKGLLDYASNLFSSNNLLYDYTIQTNGLLLTPPYYPIIKQYFNNFVGVSIDLFSDFRRNRNGIDSTEKVVSNIDAALKNGISCGVINLITRQNYDKINQIYNFYKQRNISPRFARVFPVSTEYDKESPMYLSDEEFASAMIQYFDIWANDPQSAPNNDIVQLICDILLGRPSVCFREYNCTERYIALSPGGEIYSCAEFDTPESVIGNFLAQSPQEFAFSKTRANLFATAPIPKGCHSCRYESICHGGCLRERFMLKYPFRCKSNILYWDHIVEWLEKKGGRLFMLKGKDRKEIEVILQKIF
ncbi:radical SAM protein [Prevotella communis]|uniref:radical SAM/SPASM domain-containing protein n=1 Tax=Prevotella communis TaxID=2913614 RepID=UPI001EDA6863|nr:radical SAM protein [Prevotella communis]UKK58769.1 radical SAM protein [Prevotella communis]